MNPAEFQRNLEGVVGTEAFASFEVKEQQQILRELRDSYIQSNPDFSEEAHRIAARTNKAYMNSVNLGRYIPDAEDFDFPWLSEDWQYKLDEEKEDELEKFRVNIPEIAAKDTLNHSDRAFYMNQMADEALRQVRGGDTGFVGDKVFRAFEGFVAGTLAGVGANDAAQAVRNYVPENPDYDKDFSAKLASGLGDLGSSTAIFLGASALSGGNVAVGTGAVLGSNAIRKYNDAYFQAIDLGLEPEKAVDAGLGALPGAVVDTLGDRLIAGRFIPGKWKNALKVSTTAQRREVIGKMLKDQGVRQSIMRTARDAFGEGMSEMLGDLTSGYGAYVQTGKEEFIPTPEERLDSFLIGAVLGGSIGGLSEASNLRYNKQDGIYDARTKKIEGIEEDIQNMDVSYPTRNRKVAEAIELMQKGRFKEAAAVINAPVEGESSQDLFDKDQMDSFARSEESDLPESERLINPNPDPDKDKPEISRFNDQGQDMLPLDFETEPMLPFEQPNPSAAKLSQALSEKNEDQKINIYSEINQTVPERARVEAEVNALVGEDRALDQDRATGVLNLIDVLANRWAFENPARDVNEFYKRLGFKAVENLRGFNFIEDVFTTKDQSGRRPVGRAATVVQGGRSNINVTKKADVAPVVHNLVGALRKSGILEEIIQSSGVQTLQQELGIKNLNEDGDQTIGDAMMDWMARQDQDTPLKSFFEKLKNWIKDIYLSLRTTAKGEVNEEVDQVFADLFNFKVNKERNISDVFGRTGEQIEDPSLRLDESSRLAERIRSRSSFDFKNFNPENERTTAPTKVAPTGNNQEILNRLKQRRAEAESSANKQSKKTVQENAPKFNLRPERQRGFITPEKAIGLLAMVGVPTIGGIGFYKFFSDKTADLNESGSNQSISENVSKNFNVATSEEVDAYIDSITESYDVNLDINEILRNFSTEEFTSVAENIIEDLKSSESVDTNLYSDSKAGLMFSVNKNGVKNALESITVLIENASNENFNKNIGLIIGSIKKALGAEGEININSSDFQSKNAADSFYIMSIRGSSEQGRIASSGGSFYIKDEKIELSAVDYLLLAQPDSQWTEQNFLAAATIGNEITHLLQKRLNNQSYFDSKQDIPITASAAQGFDEWSKLYGDIPKDEVESFEGAYVAAKVMLKDKGSPVFAPVSIRDTVAPSNRSQLAPLFNLSPERESTPLVGKDVANPFNIEDPTFGARYRGMEGYGFWMLTDGSVIPVNDNHAVFAKDYFGVKNTDEGIRKAEQAGWALGRAIKAGDYKTNATLIVEGARFTNQQIRNLNDWAIMHDHEVDAGGNKNLFSLSNTERVGDRIQTASKGVQFYFNLPTYAFHKNGGVSFGKIRSAKDGTISENQLTKVAGFTGSQISPSEIDFYKQLVPDAFIGGRINLRKLIEGLEGAPMSVRVISSRLDSPTELSDAEKEIGRIKHEMDNNPSETIGDSKFAYQAHAIFDDTARVWMQERIGERRIDFMISMYRDGNIKITNLETQGSGIYNNFGASITPDDIANATDGLLYNVRELLNRSIESIHNGINEDESTDDFNPSYGPTGAAIIPVDDDEAKNYQEILVEFDRPEDLNINGHPFGNRDKNIIAFARGYEEIIDGVRSFHIIEVQSDWSKDRDHDKSHSLIYTAKEASIRWAPRFDIDQEGYKNFQLVLSGESGGFGYYPDTFTGEISKNPWDSKLGKIAEKILHKKQKDFDLGKITEEEYLKHVDLTATPEGLEAFNEMKKSFMEEYDPLLEKYNQIALKAAVQHAKSMGYEQVVLSDADTAMMTEGHDDYYAYEKNPSFSEELKGIIAKSYGRKVRFTGKIDTEKEVVFINQQRGEGFFEAEVKISFQEVFNYLEPFDSQDFKQALRNATGKAIPTRAKGMNLWYNEKLPSILKKITGSKPRTVSMSQTNKDSITLRNPDGTPKNIATGRAFDISNVKPTIESLFRMPSEEKININSSDAPRMGFSKAHTGQDVSNYVQQNNPSGPIWNLIKKSEKANTFLKSVKVVEDVDNFYDPRSNTLHLSESASQIDIEHELAHALLSNAVALDPEFRSSLSSIMEGYLESESGTNAQLIQETANRLYEDQYPTIEEFFAKEWQAILKEAQNTNPELTYSDLKNSYATLNPDEFVAHVLTDNEFRDSLRSTQTQDQSLWSRILNAVLDFFGLKPETNNLIEAEKLITGIAESGKLDGYIGQKLVATNNQFQLTKEDKAWKKKVDRFNKRFNAIRRGQVSDNTDGNTHLIRQMLLGMNAKEVTYLDKETQENIHALIDNIYESRVRAIKDPDIRIKSGEVLQALENYKKAIDQAYIETMVSRYAHEIDFSLFNGDWESRDDVMEFINLMSDQLKAASETNKRLARRGEKEDAWRAKYEEVRNMVLESHVDVDEWIEDFERMNGKFASKEPREFAKTHYDYLSTLVDPEELSGAELYDHYHAINNLMDGKLAYASVTVKYIQRLRDGEVDYETLQEKFRDPMITKMRLVKGIDEAARYFELMQTQLDRFSAFIEGKRFLQEDLMGDLLNTIVGEAENNRSKAVEKYEKAKEVIEEKIGRKIDSKDRSMMAVVSRLIQFGTAKDPQKAFIKNIASERQAHENALERADRATARTYEERIIPMFNDLIAGVEDSDTPFTAFMENLYQRVGEGDETIGEARMDILNSMIGIMNEFATDAEVVSEMFYGKPFNSFVNYLPIHTVSNVATKMDSSKRQIDITDPIEMFDETQFTSQSYTALPAHLQDRTGHIGRERYYSNNIENTFDRGLRIASMTASTTAERFILKERLKKGNPVNTLILGEKGSQNRTQELQGWARTLVYNAMYNGEPMGALGTLMKSINSAFSRVALSGVHQGVTQSMSGLADYQIRTGNIVGALQALQYYAANHEKMNAWFQQNSRWIAERSTLGESELDRRQNPMIDERALKDNAIVKRFEKMYQGAGKVITASLRFGDDVITKSLVLAEYTRLMREKGFPAKSIDQMDFQNINEKVLTQAILNAERNVNASNKVLRGELFTDRNKTVSFLRNSFFAFSSHITTLAAQLNLAIRDIAELKAMDADFEQIKPKLQTIGAILGQTFVFSTGRYLINAGIATGIAAMIKEWFDDEEGKIALLNEKVREARKTGNPQAVIYAEQELREAEIIRKQINKFKNRHTSFDSFFKSVIREELSAIHFVFNGPGLPQKFLFPVPDDIMRDMMNEELDAQINIYSERIKKLKEEGKYGEAARMEERKVNLESAEYIPFHYQQFEGVGIGGIFGTSLQAIQSSYTDALNAARGDKEYNLSDIMLAAQSAGWGQADVLRYFREVDRIENEIYESRKGLPDKIAEAGRKMTKKQKADKLKAMEEMLERYR